jgi:hypothetical protein
MAEAQDTGLKWESPLRDLARKIRAVAEAHMAYSQVVDLMQVVDLHINVLGVAGRNAQREEGKLNKNDPIGGITFTELLTALCCGEHCKRESEHCHRRDFASEAARVKWLLLSKHSRQDNEGA